MVNSFEMSSYISCLIKLFFKLLDIFNNKKYYTNKTYLTLSKRFFFRNKLQKVFQYIYTVYGRRHSKLFTNCHVSWDNLNNLISPKGLNYLKTFKNVGNEKKPFTPKWTIKSEMLGMTPSAVAFSGQFFCKTVVFI